ncbi:MAG: ABC transporter substrate-binding protein [Candidatus Hadarchaeaceae archaeon]
MKRSLVIVAIVAIVIVVGAAVLILGRPSAMAEKPKSIVVRAWGGGWQYALHESVGKAFEEATGIKVEYDYTEDSELQARIREIIPAGQNPPVDVNWTIATNSYLEAQWELVSPMSLSEVPNLANMRPEAKPAAGVMAKYGDKWPYVNVYAYSYVLAYVPSLVSKVPDSWWVLWEPQYKGKIAMYDDGIGFHAVLARLAGVEMSDVLAHPEKMEAAWDLLKTLAPNIGGLGEDPDFSMWIERKEMALLVTILTNVFEAKRAGAEVAWVVPKEGLEVHTDSMEVLKNLPPERDYWAKQFINIACDPVVQGKWAELLGCPPLAVGATIPDYMKGDPAFPTEPEHWAINIYVPEDILSQYQKEWFAKFQEITG